MALVRRGGTVRGFHISNVTAATLRPIIAKHVHTDSRYMTDSGTVANLIGMPFSGGHQTVSHSEQEYVRGDLYPRSKNTSRS
jgi:hypothetical protein